MKKIFFNKIKSFLFYCKRNKPKYYEVHCLMVHTKYKTEKLIEMQKNGWEICGDILIKNDSGWVMDTYYHIPMKRKIRKQDLKKHV